MNIEEATHIILKPYVTEKTFALVENRKQDLLSSKRRTHKTKNSGGSKCSLQRGPIDSKRMQNSIWKKAFVKFATVEKARDLATKIGML